MLSFDVATTAVLATATSATDWANKLVTALTASSPLAIRLFWDAAGGTDATVSGTVFFSGTVTGSPTVAHGQITSVGSISTGSVSTAVNLTTGSAALVLVSATATLKGTLGLVGTASDFTLSANPSTTDGLGFSSRSSITGPVQLPSGTGPFAPTLTTAAPATVTLQDWRVRNSPIDVATISFDTFSNNLVYEDAELATEIGDVTVRQCSSSIVFGDFEFGATLLAANAANNITDGTKPLYQVLIAAKPHGVWPSYPFEDTRSLALATTVPEAFKIVIKNGSGAILHTIEMRDGTAINDVTQSEVQGYRGTLTVPSEVVSGSPCRPFFNCAMMLLWQSGQSKLSANASTYLPGFTSDALRTTQCSTGFSFLSQEPGCLGIYNANGLAHWYMLPRWPMLWENTGTSGPNPLEAVLEYPNTDSTTAWMDGSHSHFQEAHAEGWDYEVGSFSGHNWYTGPGGPRTDRMPVPLPLAIIMSDPTYARVRGQIPIRPMCDAWGFAYFNHSHHYFQDVKTLAGLPANRVNAGAYSYMDAYYGSGPFPSNNVSDTPTNVSLLAPPNAGDWPSDGVDKNGRRYYNGWALDALHNYCRPGLWTMMFNSPAHTISERCRYAASIMCQLGDASARAGSNSFLTRQGAWRLLALAVSWKTATQHPLGLSRAMVEDRLQAELEGIYDNLYLPAVINNANDPMSQCLRNFGLCWSGNLPVSLNHDSKSYYYGVTLVLMRQTGCWSRARALSTKCAAVLDWIIHCLDTYCVGIILDTFGCEAQGIVVAPAAAPGTNPTCYASWAAWTAANYPSGTPPTSDPLCYGWIRNSDGSINVNQANAINTMHLRAQWAAMRPDFFPEYPNSRLLDARDAFLQYYTDYLAGVNANSFSDWIYRMPSFGLLNTPDTLGPG